MVRTSYRFFILSLLIFCVGIGIFPAISFGLDKGKEKIKAFASVPIIAEWIKDIGGDKVEVTCLFPDGENPRKNSPDKELLKQIPQGDVIFLTGLKTELWAVDIATTSSARNCLFVDISALLANSDFFDEFTSQGLNKGKIGEVQHPRYTRAPQPFIRSPKVFDPLSHKEVNVSETQLNQLPTYSRINFQDDPCFYFFPRYAGILFNEIANTLSSISPKNKEIFKNNSEKMKESLKPFIIKLQKDFFRFRMHSIAICENEFSSFISELGLIPVVIPETLIEKDFENALNIFNKTTTKIIVYTDKSEEKSVEKFIKSAGGKSVYLDMRGKFPTKEEGKYISLLKKNMDILMNSLNSIKR